MTGTGPVGLALVGCGTISEQYLTTLAQCPDVRVLWCTDIDLDRARSQAGRHNVPRSGAVSDALADPDVELVVNLTIPASHVPVATQAVAAGKHIYGEKPLTLDRDAGQGLLQLAAERGLRVGSAPDTFLGAGLQSAQRFVAEGGIGTPLSGLVCFQSPGPENWHPNPDFLFARGGGPLLDIGPYYLTALVQQLGPITRVGSLARRARERREIGSGPRAGHSFPVEVPTMVTALAEFAGGAVATMVMSFDSPQPRTGFLELTGADATLRLPDPNTFGGPLRVFARGAGQRSDLPVTGTTNTRGIGVVEMARALRADVPHRASGELAMHIFDAMASIAEAADKGSFVDLVTTCHAPEPLPAGWDPTDATL